MKKIKYILFVLIFPLMIVSCQDNGLKKISVAEVTHSIFYAPLYVAQELGYFKDEGLEISIITTPGADKVMAALISKEVQIGLMGPEASVYVYNNGEKNYAVNFAQLTQKDGSFLLSKEKIDNFTWDSLKGKTIIGGRKGGMPEMILEYVLKSKGLVVGRDDPTKEVHVRTDIQFDVLAGAFSNGQGDFVALFEPTASQVIANGKGYMVTSLGKESGVIPYTCFSTTKNYLEKNKTELQKFTNAIYKALKFVNDNDAETVARAIESKFVGTDFEVIKTVVGQYKGIDAWPSDLTLKEESLSKLLDVVEAAGELSSRAPYDKIVTTEFSSKLKD